MTSFERPETLIVNFRDVGQALNQLSQDLLFPEGVLYRGGRLRGVREHAELLHIPTILNLRPQKNTRDFDATYLRVPAHDSSEIYDASHKATRRWLNKAMRKVLDPTVHLPLYVHCTSGKDRTGVWVAALLKICGVDDQWIQQEYLLSQGDVDVRKISLTLSAIQNVETYFRKVDTDALRQKFMDAGLPAASSSEDA